MKTVYTLDIDKLTKFVDELPYEIYYNRDVSKDKLSKYINFNDDSIFDCIWQINHYNTHALLADFTKSAMALENFSHDKETIKVATTDENKQIVVTEFQKQYAFEINPEFNSMFTKFENFVIDVFRKLIVHKSYNELSKVFNSK